MFTGIIEELGTVISASQTRLTVAAREVLKGTELGGSIDVNGVCLTAVEFGSGSFSVELMPETIKRSNLGLLKTGDKVNLERPLTLNKPLGGHLVQGHIDGTGRVGSLQKAGDSLLVGVEAPLDIMNYIVEKGFIAVDGISLTAASRTDTGFRVSIVGFTGQHTNISLWRIGDTVNLETDIIGKYVAQFNKTRSNGISLELLQENGFLVG